MNKMGGGRGETPLIFDNKIAFLWIITTLIYYVNGPKTSIFREFP